VSTTLKFLERLFPQVRQMRRDTIRIKSEREEWRQRYASLKARAGLDDGVPPFTYQQDGLATIHNADFLNEERFRSAYAAAVEAAGVDFQKEWRVRVALWAAEQARAVPGDFVECSAQRGFLSRAVMQYLHWEEVPKTFHLFDTSPGPCADLATLKNVRVLRGPNPDGLPQIQAAEVAYLSIKLNCVPSEIAVGEHFWPRLSPGGVILLDDYAYAGCASQKRAWDRFAEQRGTPVLGLPTGQGVLIKRTE
jgi:hypothetical protein